MTDTEMKLLDPLDDRVRDIVLRAALEKTRRLLTEADIRVTECEIMHRHCREERDALAEQVKWLTKTLEAFAPLEPTKLPF